MVGAGTRGSFSRESSVTRPTNPDEEDMDGVYRLLDHETWWKPMAISNGVVVVDCKLPASWKETSTWQGFTWRTEVGCRCSGVTSSLSLSLRLIDAVLCKGSDWRLFSFLSLFLTSVYLIVMGQVGRSKSVPARIAPINITTGRLKYGRTFMYRTKSHETSICSCRLLSVA